MRSISLVATASLLATAALAQDVPQEVTVAPDVLVSASRVPVAAEAAGSAFTIIGAPELERRQTRLVSEALRDVPGLAVSRQGGRGALTQVRIRGAEANHTLVFIDGIEAGDPFNNSGEFPFEHLLAADIERIEVLRGPQSALYGSESIGGVINIVTKRGRGAPVVTGLLEGGSFGTVNGSAAVRGGGERYHYAASAAGLHSDGHNIARAGSEDDGYDNRTLHLKGGMSPLPNLDIDAVLRATVSRTEFDPQPATVVVDGDSVTDRESLLGRLQGKLSLLDGQWEHIVGAALTDYRTDNFANAGFDGGNDGRKRKAEYQTNLYFYSSDTAKARHRLTLAAEYELEDFKNRGVTAAAAQNQSAEQATRSLVGEYGVDLWDRLFLTGALRHDDNERFEDANTWRVTGAYLHRPTATRLHASYGTGFQKPNFFELFGFLPASFTGNPDLKPETSRGFDIGVEQSFMDGRYAVDVTLFRTLLEDEIVTTFPPPTFNAFPVNAEGTSRREGVEVSARARLGERLSLAAAYTFTDAEEGNVAEIRRARHIASLNADYRFLRDRANLHLGVQYNGAQPDNEFLSVAPFVRRVTLQEFVLVTLGAGFQVTDRVRLFGRIENLLDEEYEEVFSYRTPGRAAFVGVSARF